MLGIDEAMLLKALIVGMVVAGFIVLVWPEHRAKARPASFPRVKSPQPVSQAPDTAEPSPDPSYTPFAKRDFISAATDFSPGAETGPAKSKPPSKK